MFSENNEWSHCCNHNVVSFPVTACHRQKRKKEKANTRDLNKASFSPEVCSVHSVGLSSGEKELMKDVLVNSSQWGPTDVVTATVLSRSGRIVEIIQKNQFWLSPRVKGHRFLRNVLLNCSYFPQRVEMSSPRIKAVTAAATLRFLITACRRREVFNDALILRFDILINFTGVSFSRVRNNSSCYGWQMSPSLSPESTVG